MKVLYVNHTPTVSGAERSLLDLLGALPEEVSATLAAPVGTLAGLAHERGVPVRPIQGTAGSLRLHPLHTPRALAEMAIAARQVRRAAAEVGADIVHANSIRAGIVCGLARLDAATVVHVRDCLPPGRVSRATMRLIGSTATTVVANSEYTARWARTIAPNIHAEVVYNGVDLSRFDPARIDRAAARASIGVSEPTTLLLGVVAQLSPWKGQDTAIEALAGLLEQGVDARLALIGTARFVASSTRFDNYAYVRRLRALADERGVADSVIWLGEREDVAELIAALDLLLLPSWEEPFGRAVIEAMALEVPVLATLLGGPAEILAGGGGILLAPRVPADWVRAAAELAADPARRASLGRRGRERVERDFTLRGHVESVLEVYRRVLRRP